MLDGELVIATPDGLDFDALQLRQHPAESRVKKLAAEIPASYVAFDLLALGKESLLDEPFRDRRAGLERLLGEGRSAALHHARDDEPRAGDRMVQRASKAPASTASSPSHSPTRTNPARARC